MLSAFDKPVDELVKKGGWGIGDNNVGFVAEAGHFVGTEIARAFKVSPFEVVDVYSAVAVVVAVEGENFGCPVEGCADKAAEAERFKVLSEKFGEVAPFGIIAWQEDGFAAEQIGGIFQIRIYLLLDVVVLGVKLIVLHLLGGFEVCVLGHDVGLRSD